MMFNIRKSNRILEYYENIIISTDSKKKKYQNGEPPAP